MKSRQGAWSAEIGAPKFLTASELATRWKLSYSQAYNLIGTPGLRRVTLVNCVPFASSSVM